MSSGILKPGQQSKPGQGNLPPGIVVPSSQALLLDKLHARRATPDSVSEAVASSDEEADAHRQDLSQSIQQHQKPLRRASWLNDAPQAGIRPRKGSFASSSMSPTTSHPSTPTAEVGANAWGAHPTSSNIMSRPPGSGSSFGWGQGIWNSDRKEPPARLSEVLPSPLSSLPSGNPLLGPDGGASQTSPAPRDSASNTQIPFAIPIHPTPKNYRSQSYSVGQLDPETPTSATMGGSSGIMGARGRGLPHPGLQHRPSRPSMLSEMSNEGGMLGKVKEVDDDDINNAEGAQGHQTTEAKTIEMLTRENALLRQQQLHANRMRPQGASTGFGGMANGYGLHDPVPEESSDFAVDVDESNDASADAAAKRAFGRRMSEFGSGPFRSSFSLENRPIENIKKALWSSSLGFGGLGDIPQSRRHSFADVPTRQPSIGSLGEQGLSQEPGPLDAQHAQDFSAGQYESAMLAQANPGAYFTGPGMMGGQPSLMLSGYGNMYQSLYAMQPPFANRPPSPHRGMYGMPQPRHSQKLHIVLFKCNRADVFYIQEGTGLTVKPGDLVIVEADRGTDLGTVARDNVDWAAAKEMKEHYAEEHYKWLMMFSQNAAAAQDGAGAGLMAASNGLHGGAVGGMGPPSQHHLQEPNAGELKPKLIKRHAQPHEVNALREKEGSEAKAKRVCQSKVKDHGLNMEILDAEFQMDWKKLTFYYFADSYINFNSLVTDLFKIYKTRIWMSAINPASFASPSLGLQTPSGIGPGAVGVGRNAGNAPPNERRQNQQQEPQPAFSTASAAARPFSGPFVSPFGGNERGPAPFPQGAYPYSNYAGFTSGPRPVGASYTPTADPYATAFPGSDYQLRSRGGFPQPSSATSQHDSPISPLTTQNDWAASFQGLSLNGR